MVNVTGEKADFHYFVGSYLLAIEAVVLGRLAVGGPTLSP
jgi:hypothetical protein